MGGVKGGEARAGGRRAFVDGNSLALVRGPDDGQPVLSTAIGGRWRSCDRRKFHGHNIIPLMMEDLVFRHTHILSLQSLRGEKGVFA
jgi:hypothetical protein